MKSRMLLQSNKRCISPVSGLGQITHTTRRFAWALVRDDGSQPSTVIASIWGYNAIRSLTLAGLV